MNYNIFILFFALVLLGVASCASRRSQRNEQRQYEHAIGRTEELTTDSQTHRLTMDSHHLSLGYRETATITPLGNFTYHPDSGYRGRATHVELRRERTRAERRLLHDSAEHRIRTAATIVDSVATKEIRAIERREISHTSWRWVAAALTLIVFVGFLIRRLFR